MQYARQILPDGKILYYKDKTYLTNLKYPVQLSTGDLINTTYTSHTYSFDVDLESTSSGQDYGQPIINTSFTLDMTQYIYITFGISFMYQWSASSASNSARAMASIRGKHNNNSDEFNIGIGAFSYSAPYQVYNGTAQGTSEYPNACIQSAIKNHIRCISKNSSISNDFILINPDSTLNFIASAVGYRSTPHINGTITLHIHGYTIA